jgi:hypothetical protein
LTPIHPSSDLSLRSFIFRPTYFTIAYCSSIRYVSEPSQNKPSCCPSTVYKYSFDVRIYLFVSSLFKRTPRVVPHVFALQTESSLQFQNQAVAKSGAVTQKKGASELTKIFNFLNRCLDGRSETVDVKISSKHNYFTIYILDSEVR